MVSALHTRLMARMLVRTIKEGSTIVMKARSRAAERQMKSG